uniref:TIL domain-containing protein n=1 Tax=Maylandia zebra TaxID=106582 RepID=A0A3P9BS22_9CICH
EVFTFTMHIIAVLMPSWISGRPTLTCPPNSSYSLCVNSCPETCLGVVGPPGCEEVCVEGCECNPGFILSDDKCNPWFASKCIFII